MPVSSRPLLIGITGTIGSGKSTFTSLINRQGFHVISADTLAHQRLNDAAVIERLIRRWGKRIMSEHMIDRAEIARIVFHDTREREFLNRLIHPLVLEDFQEIVSSAQDKYLFFEVPLLFEAGLKDCFDFVILITATFDTRIQRLRIRNPGDLDNQLQRMHSQLPDQTKSTLADLVIDNSGSLDELEQAVMDISQILPTIPHRSIRSFSEISVA